MAKADLTAQRVRELLNYDPETGVFVWRLARGRWGRIPAGSVAGGSDCKGYLMIGIDGDQYFSHRLAFLYMTGAWPTQQIDHMDGDGLNNRFLNLRDVDRFVNLQNRRRARSKNAAGLLGASRNTSGRSRPWKALIKVNGKLVHLGVFATPDEAHACYIEAKRRLHQGCTI